MTICFGWCSGSGAQSADWCSACVTVIDAALAQLPTAYTALLSVSPFAGSSATDVPRVSGSRERRSPSAAVDLRHEMLHAVRAYSTDLAVFGQFTLSSAVSDTEQMQQRTAFLREHLLLMLQRPQLGAQFAHRMIMLFNAAVRMVKAGPQRSLLLFPCAWCGRKCLVQQQGVANTPWYISCEIPLGGCGRLFTEQEMQWQTQIRLIIRR